MVGKRYPFAPILFLNFGNSRVGELFVSIERQNRIIEVDEVHQ
jgi:hypothetical protein